MRSICVVCLMMLSFLAGAQDPAHANRFSINGYVRDSLSGETIIGATIIVNGQSKGVTTNQYGFYSLTLDSGKYSISVTHVSYIGQTIEADLTGNRSYNFNLVSKTFA